MTNKSYIIVIADFLKSKGILLEDFTALQHSDTPLCIKVDEETGIFIALQGEDRIVLFTFSADFAQMALRDSFIIMKEALKFNSFKWRNSVEFSIDENSMFLICCCSLPLYKNDVSDLHRHFDILVEVNKQFREAHGIRHSTITA